MSASSFRTPTELPLPSVIGSRVIPFKSGIVVQKDIYQQHLRV